MNLFKKNSICLIFLLSVLWACSGHTNKKSENIYTYLEVRYKIKLDTTANIFISGFNSSGCATCYSIVDADFGKLVAKYHIPQQNVIALFPDARSIEVEHFFGNMVQLKRSAFSLVLINDSIFSKMLNKAGVSIPAGNNVAIVISPSGKVILSNFYRFMDN